MVLSLDFEIFGRSLQTISQEFLSALPRIIIGFFWFIMWVAGGYLIASFAGFAARKILYRVQIDKRLRSMDLHDSLGEISIAKVAGQILKWYIFTYFLLKGVSSLPFGDITPIIAAFLGWLPDLILGLAIIFIGLILIDFIVHKILEVKSRYVHAVAKMVKIILVITVIFTAIEQIGLNTELAQTIFLMLVATVLVTFSLALGIGLGLALKDELSPLIRKLKKNFR